MLPSFACPKITLSAYRCTSNSEVSASQVAANEATGTAMSSRSAVVPGGRLPATVA